MVDSLDSLQDSMINPGNRNKQVLKRDPRMSIPKRLALSEAARVIHWYGVSHKARKKSGVRVVDGMCVFHSRHFYLYELGNIMNLGCLEW